MLLLLCIPISVELLFELVMSAISSFMLSSICTRLKDNLCLAIQHIYFSMATGVRSDPQSTTDPKYWGLLEQEYFFQASFPSSCPTNSVKALM